MSAENYRKAVEVLEAHRSQCHFSGPKSEDLISLAERALGRKICGLYREFLKTYGVALFGGQEIYGVIDDNFMSNRVPDAIWLTLKQRRQVGLPESLLTIYGLGDGEDFCLDLSACELDGEPTVVAYTPGFTTPGQKLEVIAADFGDFLLGLVENAIAFWDSREGDDRQR